MDNPHIYIYTYICIISIYWMIIHLLVDEGILYHKMKLYIYIYILGILKYNPRTEESRSDFPFADRELVVDSTCVYLV